MPETVSRDRNAEYLRRDVFDARMEAFMAEIRLGNAEIRREMSQLENRIDAKLTQLENRVDGKIAQLDSRITQLDSKFERKFEVLSERGDQNFAFLNMRIDAMQTTVYWGFALMGLFVAILGFLITFAPPIWGLLRRRGRSAVSRKEVENIISASFDKYLGQRAGT
ncbi:MAG: hypothetical protein IJ702_06990 [Fretibacterium sp.]|nr:hypothetical protein [Fretibacterium sp.]